MKEDKFFLRTKPFTIRAEKKLFGFIPAGYEEHVITKGIGFANPYGNKGNGFKPTQGAFGVCACHDQCFKIHPKLWAENVIMPKKVKEVRHKILDIAKGYNMEVKDKESFYRFVSDINKVAKGEMTLDDMIRPTECEDHGRNQENS